ncbi:MAG: hypothetical protein LBU95_04110, partial [Rikenellaceae bacterium]|nr:hypothetical protein [Rikenellaceae bacterium]
MFGDRDVSTLPGPGLRVVVAVTGASGAIYARQLLERFAALDTVERVALIMSRNGQAVAEFEGQTMPAAPKITRYDVDDMFAAPASGSAG